MSRAAHAVRGPNTAPPSARARSQCGRARARARPRVRLCRRLPRTPPPPHAAAAHDCGKEILSARKRSFLATPESASARPICSWLA
eukprot:2629000-Prymnesium_polylepis.1